MNHPMKATYFRTVASFKSIWSFRGRSYAFLMVLSLVFIGTSPTVAQQSNNPLRNAPSSDRPSISVELLMRGNADCPSNVLLLSDLVSVQGSDALIQQLIDVPLAPAPMLGEERTWTRSDVEKSLYLRGISSDTIRWQGATECVVRKIEGKRRATARAPSNASALLVKSSQEATPALYHEILSDKVALAVSENTKPKPSNEGVQFTSAFTTPAHVTQSQNLAALAIGEYLRTKTVSNGRWNISVEMPTEYAKLFSQRNKIIGVAGGQPPWDGQQDFLFRMMGQNGEQIVNITANIKLPDMVVAAKRALSKGYLLREDDLVWIPMPRGLNYGPEDCFSQTELLVGQQLRRSMSSQQVIRLGEVGPPMVIRVGDMVSISIVSGEVTVETNGRAIESGAINDLIQIEVEPHRKRVLARITGDRTAEVIANGVTNALRNKTKSKSSSTALK